MKDPRFTERGFFAILAVYAKERGARLRRETKPAADSKAMNFFYGTMAGRLLMQAMLRTGTPKLMAAYMHSPLSRRMVRNYIRRYNISLDEYKEQEYRNFASFFIRSKDCPAETMDPRHMISPCDGLMSVFPVDADGSFAIKNSHYRLIDLVDDEELIRHYYGGICLIFRLRASDYHRYGFVADGYIGESHYIEGQLHSVQPIACEKYPVYRLNRRCWHLLETEHFGPLVQIEVGAMAVGRIVTEVENARIKRGQEMGRFELCGSTIVLLVPKDRIELRPELLGELELLPEIPVYRGMWIANSVCAETESTKE